MPSRSKLETQSPGAKSLEIKSRLFLGLGLLGLVVALSLYLLLRILLPLFAMACLGAAGFWLWKQYCDRQQKKQRQQARINAQFYQMLKQQKGQISVLDFAMRTQLDGAAAQAYLNIQAQAFSAFFDTTPQGDLIYIFNSASFGPHSPHSQDPWAQAGAHAAVHWAYAEQNIRQERARAEKANAAWTTAKQIRTLSRLSNDQSKHELASAESDCQILQRSATSRPRLAPQPEQSQPEPLQGTGGFIHMELSTAASKTDSNPSVKTVRKKKSSVRSQKKRSQKKSPPAMPRTQQNRQPVIERPDVVRGRTYAEAGRVVTIDVKAVNG